MKKKFFNIVWLAVAISCIVIYWNVKDSNYILVQYESWITNYFTNPTGSASPDIAPPVITTPVPPDRFLTPPGNLTLVTAYFDIGRLVGKGFDKERYTRWASVFRYIASPLVVYTDSDDFYKNMTSFREYFPEITKIIKFDRNKLWPFQSINRIRDIFSQPGYPRHAPNTIMPEYSALQHTKYAVVQHAIQNKYLPNKFYAWLDIGYFRDLVGGKQYFQLLPPNDLSESKVAFNQVYGKNEQLTPSQIFRGNIVWLGGGMFIGRANLLSQFEEQYRRAFNYFLDAKVMNTDQQVIYSLYSPEGRNALKPQIEIQAYIPHDIPCDPWFYLGFYCRHNMPEGKCPIRAEVCPTTTTSTTTTTTTTTVQPPTKTTSSILKTILNATFTANPTNKS